MKKLLFVALLLVAVLAEFETEQAFLGFVQKYNKKYATSEETMKRFMNYQTNLKEVQELNAETKTAVFELNQFADLSKEEFAAQKLGFVAPSKVGFRVEQPLAAPKADSIDWTTKGAVTPVKDQGQCGSCWAFSSTGAIEGQWFLNKGQLVSLSESNLVDCSKDCWNWPKHGRACNQGCNGGLQPCAFEYVKAKGIDTEVSYPYKATAGTCKYNASNVGARVSDFVFVDEDETKIAAYLAQYGPLAIAVDASKWSSYKKGIYDVTCTGQMDHAVLLVGYGTEGSTAYWKIKNSWGASWGEAGYIRIKRGNNECRVKEFVVRPVVA